MAMYRSRINNSRVNSRRWRIGAVVAVAVTVTGVGLGVASAAEGKPTITCPQVTIGVAVPAQAAADVNSNLQLLDKQIAEANTRLATSQGQGGAAFVQNAILGPLKDKRVATINRIEIAIGRFAAKPNLNAERLAVCTVSQNGNGQQATAAPSTVAATAAVPGANLGILTNSCDTSNLLAHDGFQKGDRCVSTEFGEVSSAANNSSLLITQAPNVVKVNTPFTLKVSTRNLIRDRFLAAGAGGYYVESSVLQNGIERGHFHTACRMLASTREAPDPSPVPAFFVATEDKQGSKAPDTVTIQVAGLPTQGTAQCASWAGDGSHRIPMMERANETPAIDAIRIRVIN
ncbi:Pecanex-like protein 1 [Paractinoplanes durhamensis]|uniref:Pecanex-like protein 1 n=1 Tax=Paractinoplanes durhamensis TaxID=113563 RepID=UPI003640CCA2